MGMLLNRVVSKFRRLGAAAGVGALGCMVLACSAVPFDGPSLGKSGSVKRSLTGTAFGCVAFAEQVIPLIEYGVNRGLSGKPSFLGNGGEDGVLDNVWAFLTGDGSDARPGVMGPYWGFGARPDVDITVGWRDLSSLRKPVDPGAALAWAHSLEVQFGFSTDASSLGKRLVFRADAVSYDDGTQAAVDDWSLIALNLGAVGVPGSAVEIQSCTATHQSGSSTVLPMVSSGAPDDDLETVLTLAEYDVSGTSDSVRAAIGDGDVQALVGLRSLRSMNLNGTSVGTATLGLLSQFPYLEVLGVAGTAVGSHPNDLRKLIRLPRLKSLNVASTAVEFFGLAKGELSNLERLDISETDVGGGMVFLSRLPRLKYLRLSARSFQQGQYKVLSGETPYVRFPALEVFDISRSESLQSGVPDRGLQLLAEARLPRLHTVVLRDHLPSTYVSQALALAYPNGSIEHRNTEALASGDHP